MYPSPSTSPGLPDAALAVSVRVPAVHAGGSLASREQHVQQLASPTRATLVQGERVGLYLTLTPAVLQGHAWLRLPWGAQLVRAERVRRQRQAEPPPESSEHSNSADSEAREQALDAEVLQRVHPCTLAIRIALRSVSDAEAASHADVGPPVSAAADAPDVAHHPDSDDDDEENSEPPPATDLQTPLATPHARRSASVAAASALSRSVSMSGSVAFRKSLPPASAAVRHHPARLAPGYAPHYSTPLRGQTSDESQPAWAHTQSDHHAAAAAGPGVDSVAPPSVHYFYTQEGDEAILANAVSTNEGGASPLLALPAGTLVLFIQTSLSVLPAFLSSASAPVPRKLLALEVELPSPPARHHAVLAAGTLHLPNSGAFIIDAAEGPDAGGYANLRHFVSSNRALQVPHALPPAREYVTVVDPLVIASRAVCLGSEVGSDDDAADTDGQVSCGIAVEFTLQNATSDWTLVVRQLDFLLNRSRIFLKVAAASAASHARPASPDPALASPFGQQQQSTLPPPLSPSRSSAHYLPLAQFFHSHSPSSAFPVRLAPHEQVNILCFLTSPRRGQLLALEALLRSCLVSSGSVNAVSFSLATTPLPFRTPFTVEYAVEGVASQTTRIVAQSKTVWRSHNGGGAAAKSSVTVALPFASDELKLALHTKVASPVPLHCEFPVFLTISNHGTKPTPPLQLVLLPASHPIAQQAQRLHREEEERQQHLSAGAAADSSFAGRSTRALPSSPFSPSSPDPPMPLLFSPHTPFTPTTPFGFGGQDSSSELHFPFRAVGATITRRHAATTQLASRTISESALTRAPEHPLAITTISRSSTEVLTTTLAQFLADAPSQPAGDISETKAAAVAIQEEAARVAEEAKPTADVSLSSLICLETSLPLVSIPAGGECSATLHFLALREGMLALESLFLFDASSHTYFRPTRAASVFAVKQ